MPCMTRIVASDVAPSLQPEHKSRHDSSGGPWGRVIQQETAIDIGVRTAVGGVARWRRLQILWRCDRP